MRLTKAAGKQAILHILSFFVCFAWATLLVVSVKHLRKDQKNALFVVAFLAKFFGPLQGFFNACICLHSRYEKLRKAGQTLYWESTRRGGGQRDGSLRRGVYVEEGEGEGPSTPSLYGRVGTGDGLGVDTGERSSSPFGTTRTGDGPSVPFRISRRGEKVGSSNEVRKRHSSEPDGEKVGSSKDGSKRRSSEPDMEKGGSSNEGSKPHSSGPDLGADSMSFTV